MEIFMKTLQETGDWTRSKDIMNLAISSQISASPKVFETLTYLLTTINSFLDWYKDRILSWDILEVEKEYRLDCGDFEYAFKIDVLVRENGRLKVVDWKFVYDFYDDIMCDLAPQIPRYIGALRALGIPVFGGYYAFLRYRNIKEDGEGNRYMLRPINPTTERVQNSFKDIIRSVEPIVAKKRLPLEVWHQSVRRAANTMICKSCSFRDLCVAELNGSDGKVLRYAEFEASTYGYSTSE